jgi:hypothetical protein
VARLDEAAREAFDACPASLAACRVVALLDAAVRGADPRTVEVGVVLRSSSGFRALALRALERLGAPA